MMISVNIIIISFEVWVTLDIDFKNEISRWSSSFTLTSFALNSEVLSITDSFGDFDIFSDGLIANPWSFACCAWGFNDNSLSFTCIASHLDSHWTLSIVNSSSSSTSSTFLWNSTRSAFTPFACLTDSSFLELYFFVDSINTFHEGYI